MSRTLYLSKPFNPWKELCIVYTPNVKSDCGGFCFGNVYTPKVKRKYVKKRIPCIHSHYKHHVDGDSKTGGFWFFGLIILPCSTCNPKGYIEFFKRMNHNG